MRKSNSKANHFEFADPSAYLGKDGFGANDCVIRAFCQALDMTFEELVDDFINSPGRGGGRSDLKRRLKIDKKTGRLKNPEEFTGLSWADTPAKYLCRSTGLYKWCNWDDISLDDFCEITGKKFKGIDFVVGCTNGKYDHATYVRDGKFHDLGPKYHDWMCYSFFAFKNGKSIHLPEDEDPNFDEATEYEVID